MREPLEIIRIDENNRIAVYADMVEDPQDFVRSGAYTAEQVAALPDPVGVVHEVRHKVVSTNLENAESTERFEWEEQDAVWGCYLDDEYTAGDVAQDFFGIDVE